MIIANKISAFLDRKSWIIPVLFGIMCALLTATVVLLEVRHFVNCHPRNAFSIGAELCAMIVAIMMTLSILPSYKRHSNYNRIFVTLLTIGCFALFFDSLQMMFDGDPEFEMVNRVASAFIFANSAVYLFFFWLYANTVLKSKSKIFDILQFVATILLVVNFIVPFFNLIHPFYFTINDAGSYERVLPTWYFSQNYMLFMILAFITVIILSKEKIKTKLIIAAFTIIPVVAIAVSGYAVPDGEPPISVQYTAMMASLVLIYSFLFSDNEKDLYSKNRELSVANSIQQHMLPNIFPAFPDRKEFDIYASMTPAKEVGGDFYDFFLIDETHLGIVMADVSDKGIPAALFMMASKIMVKNYAMLKQSPKDVIASVNKQICSNNQEGMFVTIWLGLLDLKTGLLTACNAGHEKPIIKKPDGHFEVYKDKHNFIVGWSDISIYTEYQIQLEKGTKIFVYTDGVPEASNGAERFGMERMVEALNNSENMSPNQILENMSEAIAAFVGKQDQFDDTTMLCLEYKGYDDE